MWGGNSEKLGCISKQTSDAFKLLDLTTVCASEACVCVAEDAVQDDEVRRKIFCGGRSIDPSESVNYQVTYQSYLHTKYYASTLEPKDARFD
jgi:hypothetical protein